MSHKEFYTNGYGVSIACNEFSYGGRDGLFEVAILKGDEDDYDLCYDTPITSDVIGHLTSEEVEEIIKDVKNLPQTLEALSKNRDNKIDDLCG
jgi:hypothetical protein